MKLISHRGNIRGLNPNRENAPSYIDSAIGLNYEVEIDLRLIQNELWLGHDGPEYKVELTWLSKRKDFLWIHCKNPEAATFLAKQTDSFQYFCHTHDPFVLTSTGHLWIHDLNLELDRNTIIPLLDKSDIDKYSGKRVYGICTDFVEYCKKLC